MLASFASSGTLVQLALGGFGLTGLIGAVVAVYKLRPDINSAAVVQAQGTMDMMKQLVDELREELDRAHKEIELFQARVVEQEGLIKQLRDVVRGAALMESDD